jgi:hypothetical protein
LFRERGILPDGSDYLFECGERGKEEELLRRKGLRFLKAALKTLSP